MCNSNKKQNLTKIVRDLKNFERDRLPEWVIAHQKEVAIIAYRMGELLKLDDKQLAALAIAANFLSSAAAITAVWAIKSKKNCVCPILSSMDLANATLVF